MSFIKELVESIWQPGVNRALLVFIHSTFACLLCTNMAMVMLVGWRNVAMWVMTLLSVSLYLALLWYPVPG